jgi:hypothetical protein
MSSLFGETKRLAWLCALAPFFLVQLFAQTCPDSKHGVAPSFHYPERGFSVRNASRTVKGNLSGLVLDSSGSIVNDALVEILAVQDGL